MYRIRAIIWTDCACRIALRFSRCLLAFRRREEAAADRADVLPRQRHEHDCRLVRAVGKLTEQHNAGEDRCRDRNHQRYSAAEGISGHDMAS